MLNQLKNIGLSDKEAKVYLAMLELGPAPVLEIAAKAGINRPTAYVQIEALKQRGLVSTVTKGKKQLFQAESPEQLEILVSRTVAETRRQKETLEEIMPELRTLFNTIGEKPQVRFFEGIEGLKRMQQDFLTTKGREILGIYSADDVYALFPNLNLEYSTLRQNKKIKSRSIYTSSKGRISPESEPKRLRESRFVPDEQLPFSSDITIYDNKVAIASLRGKIVGAIIENQGIADSFRGLFELAWNLISRKK